jgi:hypothetical protein
MISTRDLSGLPTIDTLKKLTQSLAMLDAVIEPEWDYRYYSFNSKWASNELMASMRNGQGDSWFCGFGAAGVFLKGFDHESAMSPWNANPPKIWPGVLESVPQAFQSFATEPAFSMRDTTFCIWRGVDDISWNVGNVSYPDGDDPDGSGWMLTILDGNPSTYKDWAESYYEHPVSLSGIKRIYEYSHLTPETVRELNPNVDFSTILADSEEIGYPIG